MCPVTLPVPGLTPQQEAEADRDLADSGSPLESTSHLKSWLYRVASHNEKLCQEKEQLRVDLHHFMGEHDQLQIALTKAQLESNQL